MRDWGAPGSGFIRISRYRYRHTVKFRCRKNNKFFFSIHISSKIFVFSLTILPGTGLIYFQERAWFGSKSLSDGKGRRLIFWLWCLPPSFVPARICSEPMAESRGAGAECFDKGKNKSSSTSEAFALTECNPSQKGGRRFSVHLTLGQLGHLGAAPCGKYGLQKRYQNQWCPLEAPAVPIKESGVLKEVKVSRKRWRFLKGSVLLYLVQQKITVTCKSWRRGQISFVSRLGISPEHWQWKEYWDGRHQAQPTNLKVKDPEGSKAPYHCIRCLCLWAWGECLLLTTEWLPCAPLKPRPGQESPT